MKNEFSTTFLNEIFLLCFYKLDMVDIVNEHLQYEYIPKEMPAYKKVLKSIKTIYINTGKLPTFGVISQQHQADLKVQEVISDIKKTTFPDKEIVLEGLDEYIKLAKFEQLSKRVVEKYNSGDHDKSKDFANNRACIRKLQTSNRRVRNSDQTLHSRIA